MESGLNITATSEMRDAGQVRWIVEQLYRGVGGEIYALLSTRVREEDERWDSGEHKLLSIAQQGEVSYLRVSDGTRQLRKAIG